MESERIKITLLDHRDDEFKIEADTKDIQIISGLQKPGQTRVTIENIECIIKMDSKELFKKILQSRNLKPRGDHVGTANNCGK